MAEYKEYPKWMHHPNYVPATVIREERDPRFPKASPGAHGEPAKFAPQLAVSLEDEERWASLGYLPAGVGDSDAYHAQMAHAATPNDHVHHEFPKWKYHYEEAPVLVQDAEEEAALGPWWFDRPDLVQPEEEAAEAKPRARKQSRAAA